MALKEHFSKIYNNIFRKKANQVKMTRLVFFILLLFQMLTAFKRLKGIISLK